MTRACGRASPPQCSKHVLHGDVSLVNFDLSQHCSAGVQWRIVTKHWDSVQKLCVATAALIDTEMERVLL